MGGKNQALIDELSMHVIDMYDDKKHINHKFPPHMLINNLELQIKQGIGIHYHNFFTEIIQLYAKKDDFPDDVNERFRTYLRVINMFTHHRFLFKKFIS